jgi:CHAT domain-containing protein
LETSGLAAYLLTEAWLLQGQDAAAQEVAYRGLTLLTPFRRSHRLVNHLERVAEISRRAGLRRAALAIMSEVLEVAPDLGRPEAMALALCARARDQSALGHAAAAQADLQMAARWAERMPHRRAYERIRGVVLLFRGEITRASDPRAALPVLDSAVSHFEGFQGDVYRPMALFHAAAAARDAGDLARSRAWLRDAVDAAERQQTAFTSTPLRATFAETVEKITDLVIVTKLDDAQPDEAFAYLERARLAAWPLAERAAPPVDLGSLQARLPADMLVLDFALLPDRLAIWSVSREGRRAVVAPVGRDSIARLARGLAEDLAAPRPDSGGISAQLFELLLGPFRAELSRHARVAVVPDRELHAVPFGALWDRRSGRFAIESHEFRTAPSGGFLRDALRRRPPGGGAALVIGEPALDSTMLARLGPLPGARAEARRVARLYPGAELLLGPAAGRAAVLQRLGGASLVHFAGHAVFDSDRPERSYLALASGRSDDGRLSAGEIGGLRLSNTAVVVLSACSTLNARPSRAGGVAGLAYSFLRAGAPATISTLWDVRDDAVVEMLVQFHQQRRGGASSSEALHRSQLWALRSADPLLRAPRTWGAFTYTGG